MLVFVLKRYSLRLARWILLLNLVSCAAAHPETQVTPIPAASPKVTLMNSPELLIGAARRDITPREPVIMGGYGVFFWSKKNCRWSTGVHDPLYATALVVQKGSEAFALLSLDLIGLASPDVNIVRGRVAERTGLSPGAIVVSSNHTHQGPDTLGLWGTAFPPHSGRNEAYVNFVKEQAVQVVVEAFKGRRPGRLKIAVGELNGLHRNIRTDTDPSASIDHTMTVLLAEDLQGSPIATLTNWACHPTAGYQDNTLISSDWIGSFYQTLDRAKLGISMFVNGSIGATVQPFDPRYKLFAEGQALRWAEDMGPKVADAALQLLNGAVVADINAITVQNRTVTVAMRNRSYRLARTLGLLSFDLPRVGDSFSTTVTAIHAGPIAIGTAPGEIAPHLGMRVRSSLGGSAQIIISNAQDALGYIIDPSQYVDRRYRYERMLCIGPDFGSAIVAAHRDMAASRL